MITNAQKPYSEAAAHLMNVANNRPRETRCSKITKYVTCTVSGILGYLSEYPTLRMARIFGGQAAFATFGSFNLHSSFGFWRSKIYQDVSELQSKIKYPCLKVAAGATAVTLAICSRTPSAGLALQVAPGLPDNQRPWWALAGLLGTFWPEAFSGMQACMDWIRHYKDVNAGKNRTCLYKIRDNLLNYIQAKQNFILRNGRGSHYDSLTSMVKQYGIHMLFTKVLRAQLPENGYTLDSLRVKVRKSVSFSIATVCGTTLFIENVLLTKFCF